MPCGGGPDSCAADGGLRDHILGSSTPPTLPGIGAPPPWLDYPNLENTSANTLRQWYIKHELRNHFLLLAHPCWPRPAAGRQGPDGQYGGRGRLWSSEGRTGRQAEPPGVSPQTACSEPQACKSQPALPR